MLKSKIMGQVFTPSWIVNKMLDLVNYNNSSILSKKVLEPSCGDGAFLTEIAKRLIETAKKNNYTSQQIKQFLEQNIIGIEIDQDLHCKCIENLNKIADGFFLPKINWNIKLANALTTKIDKVDLVIGNPPYIRVHNLDNENRDLIKNNYKFCKSGTTDIYIAFYEYAILNIKKDGLIAFITPNSFLRNSSSKLFRDYIENNSLLDTIIDFGSENVFENVSVYAAICILKQNSKITKYFKYQNKLFQYIKDVSLSCYKKQNWYFNLESPTAISLLDDKNVVDMRVQYGIATLRDKIYISNITDKTNDLIEFNGVLIEKNITKKIVKASLSNPPNQRIIYPYKVSDGIVVPIDEDEMQKQYPRAYQYLLSHKNELLMRDMEKKHKYWYEYGRSQGLQNINQQKLVISPVVKDSIKVSIANSDTLTYSGMFLISNEIERVCNILQSTKFINYVKQVGKDIQNNYKTFNTKQVKMFFETMI